MFVTTGSLFFFTAEAGMLGADWVEDVEVGPLRRVIF